jgi:NADH-quinone oxidoreductase subunit L
MDSMNLLVILIPAFPLMAALLIPLLGPRLLKEWSHLPAVLGIGASFVCSFWLLLLVHGAAGQESGTNAGPRGFEHVVTLWQWAVIEDAYVLPAGAESATDTPMARDLRLDIVLRTDSLTATMLTMVTFISTLVAIFGSGYMHGDRGYWRFFTYISLFVFSMTMLVSVSNFVLLFVFWEAVGVCSYLLIGFWYQKPEAAAAGKKAFLVNRVGDFGFTLAIFLIWTTYGTLNYHDTLADGSVDPQAVATAMQAEAETSSIGTAAVVPDQVVLGVLSPWRILRGDYVGGTIAVAICLLLLVGACGKSAQFPLHVWLPDAMEGPTPVSALIHAATMVTAGVYMITRCSPLFMVSPESQLVVACIGGTTALLAGIIALTQYDLKRVLAYSTVSQLGYMLMGLGVGTFGGITAGMFHLFTHAFFKALLFLGAGSVMHAMGNVIDMRRFGGLRHRLPITHWTFLIGSLALAGFPPLAGFWSKDSIIAAVHERAHDFEHELEHRAHPHDAVQPGHGGTPENHAGPSQAGHASHALPASGHEHVVQPVALLAAAPAETGHTTPSPLASLTAGQLRSYAAAYQWLYYLSLLTAFLTAFYVARSYFMTFFGEERIPPEAGHHAHESPWSMCLPLVILAFFAAGVGIWFDRTWLNHTHPFKEFLSWTPSLAGGLVAATKHPYEFHLTTAALSAVIAAAGGLLGMYLYVGDQREVKALKYLFDFAWVPQLVSDETAHGWSEVGWVKSIRSAAGAVGLSGLASLLGNVVLLIWIVLSSPLLFLRYVSPYRLSYDKFFIDQIYDVLFVWPLRGCAVFLYLVDRWIIDGFVNLMGWLPVSGGQRLRKLQNGLMPFYILAMVLLMVAALTVRVLFAAN